MSDPHIKLTPDILEWLKNPRMPEDDEPVVSFEAPLMHGEEQVATITLEPSVSWDTREVSLNLTIKW